MAKSEHSVVSVGAEPIDLATFARVSRGGAEHIALDVAAKDRMLRSHRFFCASQEARIPIYGLNTQFGDQVTLLDRHLDDYETDNYRNSLVDRQYNLVRSHNCGLGDVVDTEIVRGAMLLRAQCLSRGYSGVRPEVVEGYLAFVNLGITPLCYRFGSIGASGDLIPLATIASAVLGERVDVRYRGGVVPVAEAFNATGLKPLKVQGREGLALVNGTSFMSSVAGLALHDLVRLYDQMLDVVAITLESLLSIWEGYSPIVHELKGHVGQLAVAKHMQAFWKGSQLMRGLGTARAEGVTNLGVQDYYSLRSVAHGFGVFHENLARARQWIEAEMYSVNDNPVVAAEEQSILHTANFMGYYVSSACDMLRADIAQSATWLHALLANLVHPRKNRGLPTNIIEQPEVFSGFRPVQILAASLAVQCRKLAQTHASFVLPTEGDNQDVNSLGTHSAFDLRSSVEILEQLVAVLLMAGCQALELRGVEQAGAAARSVFNGYRKVVPFLKEDRLVQKDLVATVKFLRETGSLAGRGVHGY
jgi:histidine ammonia-lyase